jgi:serine/threonine protein kinase/tetratricopeptide (TPR) repeat protein
MSMRNPTPPHAPVDPATAPLARGASIGRYVVLGLVGRGGMGEVYAAYDPELDRKVAVKLLRVKAGNGVSLAEGRQRTLREAQAIARLSHPNVVVAYDVGTFDEKVFIAMEFVDGNTVTYWLEQQQRTWQEILRIFIAAGRGLIAAHEKGLVHRDFKPDNVMVGKDGQVRVMDFGLARAMPERPLREHRPRAGAPNRAELKVVGSVGTETLPLDQGTLVLNQDSHESLSGQSSADLFDARLTRTGAMMGTPAYMAPEQFFGAATDARTDQFSFCVSLYEALYGERPFEGKRLTELTAAVVQGTVRNAPAGTKVPFWVRKILLRGLRSAAAERYPSMAELLEELGKDPRAKRRKWMVGAALALLPLAVGFGVRQSIVSQRVMCGGGGDKFAGIWELHSGDRPEGPRQSQIHSAFMSTGKSYAADVYETVSRALTRYAQGWSAMYQETCEATHVRHEQSDEVLDLRMSCLQERLNGVRALSEVFAEANGEVVENAVSATNALATLDGCSDVPTLRAVIKPPDDPAVRAKVALLRRRLTDLKARFDAGQRHSMLDQARRLLTEVKTVGYAPLEAEAMALVGQMDMKVGDSREAERTLTEAVAIADAARHDDVRAEAAANLAYVVGYQEGRFDEAARWAVTAKSVLDRLGGRELLQAWLLNDIGCVDILRGAYEAAIPALQQSIALKQKALGADHPDVGRSEGNLGMAFQGLVRNEDALAHLDKSLALLEKGLGAGHPDLADQLSNRGEILNALGRYSDARRSFERAQAIWERELGSDNLNLGFALTGIGLSFLAEGKPSNALVPLERAFDIRTAHELEPSRRADTSFALAKALWESNRSRARARELAEKARTEYVKAVAKERLQEVDSWLRTRTST